MDEQFNKYSDAEAHRVARLIAGFIRGTLSNKERDELDEWICASDENMQLFEKLTDEKNVESAMRWMQGVDTEKALEESKKNIKFNKQKPRKIWKRVLHYAVAASLIIAIGILWIKPFSNKGNGTVIADKNDLAPGGNKAVLTLADKRKIILDTSGNGTIASQGTIDIKKSEGLIEYVQTNSNTNEVLYNSVTTPAGGQYKLTLSDGTKVWLNALSSIKYPVSFNENERVVSIEGEVYFEVATSLTSPGLKTAPSKGGWPFKVKVNNMTVEVLGTHFNINAYADEPFIRTTLEEGSVRVSMVAGQSSILKPGEQAKIGHEGTIEIGKINTDEVLAWKNGKFWFEHATIEDIMRQVSRWYDADIHYQAKPNDHFNAIDVSRDVPVSKLLAVLELTKRVHFKIEEKKITVMN
jgi:transmembrane sensor